MHTKSYSEHLRSSQYCGFRWRILKLNPLCNQQSAENLPQIRVIRERCHSKACPRCQLLYYRKIRSSLRKSEVNNSWFMFTITGIHHYGEEREDLYRLEENFRELRKKLKRKFPNFRYFAIKELSPSGNWHYHGLWNIRFNWYELRAMWNEISGSNSVFLKKVYESRGSINYIFKYAFKSVNNSRELLHLYESDKRKFSSSKGLLAKNKNPNPYTSEYGISYNRDELVEELYSIVHNTQLSIDDFSSTDYPYFEDLMFNLYDRFIQEHPPNLFGVPQKEKIPYQISA